MKVLIIFAHPNPMSFTHAILDSFVRGLSESGHGPLRRLVAKLYIKNKSEVVYF
jgi:putative NADPH-quinone reductase